MKRDMDLVRTLLLMIEDFEAERGPDSISLENHSDEEVNYHLMLLEEAGLIDALKSQSTSRTLPIMMPSRLTWNGHEFLDAARDDARWKTAKGIFSKLGNVTMDVALQILTKIMMDQATKMIP